MAQAVFFGVCLPAQATDIEEGSPVKIDLARLAGRGEKRRIPTACRVSPSGATREVAVRKKEPKPTPGNERRLQRYRERIANLRFNERLPSDSEQYEVDLALALWNRKYKPAYEKRVLDEYEKHVLRHFDKHTQYTNRELWNPPSFADFRRKRGRPRDEDFEKQVLELHEKGHSRQRIVRELRRRLAKEGKREKGNLSQEVGRVLRRQGKIT